MSSRTGKSAKRSLPPGAPNPHVMRVGKFSNEELEKLEIKQLYEPTKPVSIRLSDLNLDLRYQYSPEQEPHRLKSLKTWLADRGGYDPIMAGTILVSRRTDGSLWTCDGGGRSWMARQAGCTHISATVYDGLTWEQEAAIFRMKNMNNRRVRDLHIFLVAANEQIEPNATIVTMTHAAGYAIERTVQNRKSAILGVGSLLFAHQLGPRILERTLFDLRNTWGDKSGSQIDGRAVVALSVINAAFPKIDQKRLREVVLGKHTFAELAASARQRSGTIVLSRSPQSRDVTPCITFLMMEIYNKALAGSKRLSHRDVSALRSRFTDEVQYQDVWRWDV